MYIIFNNTLIKIWWVFLSSLWFFHCKTTWSFFFCPQEGCSISSILAMTDEAEKLWGVSIPGYDGFLWQIERHNKGCPKLYDSRVIAYATHIWDSYPTWQKRSKQQKQSCFQKKRRCWATHLLSRPTCKQLQRLYRWPHGAKQVCTTQWILDESNTN